MGTSSKTFVVITKTTFSSELRDQVIQFSLKSLPIFKKQAGLINIRMHEALDGTHMSSYMEWESEAHHLACMQSQDFSEINSQWASFIESGNLSFAFNTYNILGEG